MSKNKEEDQYLDMMRDLLENGDIRKTRNATVKSLFSRELTFDLSKAFPLLTTKKMFLRGIFEELMFFINGKTQTKTLEEKGVNIWKGNTCREFLDNTGLNYEEGDMGPMYGFVWRHCGAKYDGGDKDYQGKGFDQLQYVIDTLLKDPYSRRIIMTTYSPPDAKEGCLFPCHSVFTQFYVTERNEKMYVSNLTVNRSQDVFLGNPYNIASSSLFTYLICHHLNHLSNCDKYVPDRLTMVLGDYHLYDAHYDAAKEQITRTPHPFPMLRINKFRDNIEDYKFEDIEVVDYVCDPVIKAPMVT